ncbi:Alpha-aminoadipic semialdehyde synthase, mitochondrial [Hypsizygus marmoreus]|uniref:Alpha-aminoadipic semialdehyde synthase, mitochondrial n=1 Tax=Hypsizygus marmoreus TaxID=39966 RepID=A0A369JIM8_HYPMA|nr:Alpha-aminoadipic semialdehyde synthase, mitochondrial [Hypsizygus marmoreus]
MHKRAPSSLLRLSTASGSRPPLTVGIRREDPQRIWERRTPLTPEAVQYLVSEKKVDVEIEHCDRRVFSDAEYAKAGAKVRRSLGNSHIILGIKETPLHEVITSPLPTPVASHSTNPTCARTHLMFSHTAKGQPYNTPLLAKFVAESSKKNQPTNYDIPRLIDYELLTNDSDGKRTVGFGWFAGVAGVLESLSAMAHSHLEVGIASPFLYTPRPHTHPSLESLRSALRTIGNRISEEGTPPSLGPFVIGLTGTGKVSQGCLSILAELPIVEVSVSDLPALVSNKDADLTKIYLVHAKPEDYLVGLDGRKYDREHYYAHPQSYRSTFCDTVAPYLTLFLNGVGWLPTFPRLMTNEQLTVALDRARSIGGARFTNIGDISCDVEGGLQFLTRATTLSSPFYKIRPPTLPASHPSVQMMSVDILPASLPLDASQHFSKVLLPYLESLIDMYTTGNRDEYSAALERATIAEKGQLADKHAWLQEAVDKYHSEPVVPNASANLEAPSSSDVTVAPEKMEQPGLLRKKRMLLLGSGMVAGPTVDEIAKRGDIQLIVASNSLQEVEKLTQDYLNVQYRVIDMSDKSTVSDLIAEADVVISLLPVAFHTTAAELCIFHHKHLVTASYISNDMRSLHSRAVAADVLLLNEIGLDPGIDHCSAIDLLSQMRAQKKEIVSFTSFCGGLPAPDVLHVPLRYKFSWSPKGVLSAALNSARFRLQNKIYVITGDELLKKYFPDVPITNEFELEGIANRDSMPYADTYGIQNAQTILRGTLRYPGFSNLMQSFKELGLLETQKKIYVDRWTSFVPQCLALTLKDKVDEYNLYPSLDNVIPSDQIDELHDALDWLSLLPSNMAPIEATPMPLLPAQPMTPIDIFAYLLAHKLAYKPHERDMVVLSHEIITQQNSSSPKEVHTSSLITYGTPKASAMARTVGLPVAFAALNVIDGKIAMRGVHGPTDASIYKPVLRGLEQVGLGMKESTRVVVDDDTLESKLAEGIRRSMA